MDDPYIALASAQTVLRRHDPIYGSPALVGVTSPPFVAALVALLWIGISPLEALRLLAALGGATAIIATIALGRALRLAWGSVAVLAAAFVTSYHAWLHLVNGLETGFAVALLAAMIGWAQTDRQVPLAVAAGLLPWLRPDLGLVSGALALYTLWPRHRRLLLLTLLAGLPWLLWTKADTGAWLPQTIAAKQAFFAESARPLAEKLAIAARGVWRWLVLMLPLSLGLLPLLRSAVGRVGLLFSVATLALYIWMLPSAVVHNSFRYLYPILVPWMLLGFGMWLATSWRVLRRVAIVLGFVGVLFYQRSGFTDQALVTLAQERVEAARWLAAQTEPDAVILVHDAGAAALWSERRLVDVVGLKTPRSISVHRAITLPSAGAHRARAVALITRSSGAGYVIMTQEWDDLFKLASGLREQGAILVQVRSAPFRRGYVVYRIVFPDRAQPEEDSRGHTPRPQRP